MKKVLLIKGISQYDAMRIYIDEYAKGLKAENVDSVIVDTKKDSFVEDCMKILATGEIDWVFTCNGILLDNDFFNNVLNYYQVKKCTFIYDHPIYQFNRLFKADRNTVVFCCDQRHVNFMEKYYKNINIGKVGFLPLSGSYLENSYPYEERKIDLLFTGTFVDMNRTFEELKNLPEVYYKIALKLIEIMIVEPSLTIEDALNLVLDDYQFERTDEEFHDILITVRQADQYVREYFREKLVRTIIENDILLNVHGYGWESFPSKKKDNIIIRNGYGKEALKSLLQTKISLNIMPWFRGGFQERIASAMLSGAVSLTDTSDYIEDNFVNGKNIVIYSLKKMYQLPEIISNLLDNPDKASMIARNGYTEAVNKHTWHHRMKDVLNVLQEFESQNN